MMICHAGGILPRLVERVKEEGVLLEAFCNRTARDRSAMVLPLRIWEIRVCIVFVSYVLIVS
jgi:hypothetical protein